jgi:hypothetical protein
MWMVQLQGAWQPADTDDVVFEWIRQGAVGPDTLIRHSSWATPRRTSEVPTFQHFAVSLAPSVSHRVQLQWQPETTHQARSHPGGSGQLSSRDKLLIAAGAVVFGEIILLVVLFQAARYSGGAGLLLFFVPILVAGVVIYGRSAKRAPATLSRVAKMTTKGWRSATAFSGTLLTVAIAGIASVGSHAEAVKLCKSALVEAGSSEVIANSTSQELRNLRARADAAAVTCDKHGLAWEAQSLRAAVGRVDDQVRAAEAAEAKAAEERRRKEVAEAAAREAERKRKLAASFSERAKDIEKAITTAAQQRAKKDYEGADASLKSVESQLDDVRGTDAETSADWKRLKPQADAQRKLLQPILDKIARAEQAQADKEKREEDARQAAAAALKETCGEVPLVSAWDGSIPIVERHLRSSAHDPDSIEVSECTTPVLNDAVCWVSTCKVRGNNAFGGKILQIMRFAMTNDTVLAAEEVR